LYYYGKVLDLPLTFFVNLSKVPVSFFPVGLVVEEEPPDNKINKLLIVLGEKKHNDSQLYYYDEVSAWMIS